MTAQEAIAAFDRFEAEALAVVDFDRAPSGDWPAQRDPCLAALFDASERQRGNRSAALTSCSANDVKKNHFTESRLDICQPRTVISPT